MFTEMISGISKLVTHFVGILKTAPAKAASCHWNATSLEKIFVEFHVSHSNLALPIFS